MSERISAGADVCHICGICDHNVMTYDDAAPMHERPEYCVGALRARVAEVERERDEAVANAYTEERSQKDERVLGWYAVNSALNAIREDWFDWHKSAAENATAAIQLLASHLAASDAARANARSIADSLRKDMRDGAATVTVEHIRQIIAALTTPLHTEGTGT